MDLTRDALLDLFRRSGALLEGHFRLTSGLHSPGYLQCALVLQHPAHAEALGRAIAENTRMLRPTIVAPVRARSAAASIGASPGVSRNARDCFSRGGKTPPSLPRVVPA